VPGARSSPVPTSLALDCDGHGTNGGGETGLTVAMMASRIPPAYSGAGAQALALASHLREHGVMVELLSYNRVLASRVETINGVTVRRSSGERLVRALPSRYRNPARTLIYCLWLTLRLAVGRYDVYHVHGNYLYAVPAAIVGRIRRIPVVIKVTCLGDDDAAAHAQRRWGPLPLGWFYNFTSRTASAIIALNAEIARSHRDLFPSVPIAELPNGVDMQRFAATAARRVRGRRALDIDDDTVVALFVGYIGERKGITDLLQGWFAFEADRGGSPSKAVLLLVGPKANYASDFAPEAFELATSSRGRAAGIRLLEQVGLDDMPQIYASADVFLLPSRAEGMANSVLEAMAAGLPVIATQVPGNIELLAGESGSIVIPPRSPSAIAQALRQIESTLNSNGSGYSPRTPRLPDAYSLSNTAARYRRLYETLRRS
jgi:glycosyltransferase involved in cell wall biosynthesis